MPDPRVVGLDLSLSSTGIATPDGQIITHGYSLPKAATDAERVTRLTHLRDHLLTICRRRCSCGDTGWIEDEGWSPYEYGPPAKERRPWDGLVPCGWCNHGDDDHRDPAQPRHGVDLVVIEGFSFGSPQGATEAGGLGWTIRIALTEACVPFAVVPPSTLKKFATGKGNAGKDDMKLAALSRLGIEFTGKGSGDRCDATWLRVMGLDALGCQVVDLPAVNRQALAKVAWPEVAG